MPSRLFQVATARQQQSARSAYRRSPLPRLARDVSRILKASEGHGHMQVFSRALLRPEVRQLLAELDKGRPVRYAGRWQNDEYRQAVDKLLRHLGPVGEVIRSVVTKEGRDFTRDSLDAAIEMVRTFGGEVMVRPGHTGYDRGVEAARQLLEEAGYDVTKRGTRRGEREPDQPQYIDRNLEPSNWLYETEQRVESASVHSYAFSQETETMGTLYVTFRAWKPGQKEPSDLPGATYAYHAIPVSKYQQFRRAAARSAGEAVWDYLRVRGTSHAHQHPYELVGGVPVQPSGVYIPRKATQEGFFRRAIQRAGQVRGIWQRSQLPSREYAPPRGTPNRGTPNRGRP
ncbi:MAG: hypothetical protein FJ276_09055 [Planctomycetes bacterium]|nr:hypothetical protein [Planctomycetota bacterium]